MRYEKGKPCVGSNFKVKVRSVGLEHLEASLRMAYANCPGGNATHYVTPIPAHKCQDCMGRGRQSSWSGTGKEYVEYQCDKCIGSGQIPEHEGMVFLWHEDNIYGTPAKVLPYPMSADAAINFFRDWLEVVTYPEEPDHDGSNVKGFLVSTGNYWGHVEECSYAFLGVYPVWQEYGK